MENEFLEVISLLNGPNKGSEALLQPGPSKNDEQSYSIPTSSLKTPSTFLQPDFEYPVIHLEESDDNSLLISDSDIFCDEEFNDNSLNIATNSSAVANANCKAVAKKSTGQRPRKNYLKRLFGPENQIVTLDESINIFKAQHETCDLPDSQKNVSVVDLPSNQHELDAQNYVDYLVTGSDDCNKSSNDSSPICQIMNVKSVKENINSFDLPISINENVPYHRDMEHSPLKSVTTVNENKPVIVKSVSLHRDHVKNLNTISEWNQSDLSLELISYDSLETGIEVLKIKQEQEELNIYDINGTLLENYHQDIQEDADVDVENIEEESSLKNKAITRNTKRKFNNKHKNLLNVTKKGSKSNHETHTVPPKSVITSYHSTNQHNNLQHYQTDSSATSNISKIPPPCGKGQGSQQITKLSRKRKLNTAKRTFTDKVLKKSQIIKRASKIKGLSPYNILDHFSIPDILKLGGEAPRVDSEQKFGFERGLKPEAVIGSFKSSNGGTVYIIKWHGSNTADLVMACEANQQCPELVLKYYDNLTDLKKPLK